MQLFSSLVLIELRVKGKTNAMYLSLYLEQKRAVYFAHTLDLPNALITYPRVTRDLLMLAPSVSLFLKPGFELGSALSL